MFDVAIQLGVQGVQLGFQTFPFLVQLLVHLQQDPLRRRMIPVVLTPQRSDHRRHDAADSGDRGYDDRNNQLVS